jgi:ribosomal protein S20
MKITRSALKNLIKEEMNRINEGPLSSAATAAASATLKAAADEVKKAVAAGETASEAAAEAMASTFGVKPTAPAILSRDEIRDAWRRIKRTRPDSEAFFWSGEFHVGDSGLVFDEDRVAGDTLSLGVAKVEDLDDAIIKAIEGKGNVPEGSWKLSFHVTSIDDFKKNDPEGYAEVQKVLKGMGVE